MALKTYLLVHNNEMGAWTEIRDYLESNRWVVNWMYFLPNAFLIVTELASWQLSEVIRSAAPETARFLVINTNGDRNGWLPREAWDLMNTPAPPAQPQHPALPALNPKRKPPAG